MRRILKHLGGAALVALAAGPAEAAKSLTETQSYTFPLAPGGRVLLKNLQGDISVERWDEPRVSVEVQKVGEGRTDEDVREAMALWKLDVQNGPDRVSLEADIEHSTRSGKWDRWNDRDAEVSFHFTAKVPRDAALDLSTVNGERIDLRGDGSGRVDARNVNGDVQFHGAGENLDLSTVNGSVKAELVSVSPTDRVNLQTVNGSVYLFIAETADAQLQVHSLNGKLYSNLALPRQTIESFIGFEYETKLGAGGGRIRLETVHGPVRILKPGSEPRSGESIVEVRPKEFDFPAITFEWDKEISESVREAAQEAREGAREAAQAAREAAREGAREARRAMRDAQSALRGAHRGWKESRDEDNEPVRLGGVISGNLDIRESNEGISVGQVEGNASLVTFAGDIEVSGIGGQGKLLTYGGSIEVGHAAGALEAETYGGDIEIQSADAALGLKTKGGDISVQKALAGVSAETLGGDIRLQSVRGPIAARTNGGEIQARLEAPLVSGEILLESLGGDLSLVLPKGMGADLRVEIVVSRRDASERFLRTNVEGLQRTVQEEGGEVLILYLGSINGGGSKVTLKTHAGEVSLQESGSP